MAGQGPPPAGRPPGNVPGRFGNYPVGYPGRPGAGANGGGRTNGGGRPNGYGAGYQVPDPFAEVPRAYSPNPSPSRPPEGYKRYLNYPRHGRNGWRKWVPSWKLVAGLIGTGFALMIVLFSVAYASVAVPKNNVPLAQTTIFYYGDGKTEIGRLATQNRQVVDFATIPPQVRYAVLAAEDRTFYENSGVDPTSIIRAAVNNVRGGATQGGSTITQQYVKNIFAMQKNRTFSTKFKEFFIALKITKSMKKDQILGDYLNTIYFGRGAYGIQAASQAYFGKDVNRINASQAAYLAGIINGPSLADDPGNSKAEKAQAVKRWNFVLDGMAAKGWVSAADRAKYAKQGFPKVRDPSQRSSLGGQNGYLVKMAQQEAAADLHVTMDAIETGGYKIVTTFNKRMVNAGVQAVKTMLPPGTPKSIHVGLASIDPKTGAILAVYGGKDYIKSQFNQATLASAQGGSTFKAFALLAALDNGYSLYSRYNGYSPQMVAGKKFENFGNEQLGNITLLDATRDSVNTVFAQLNNDVGPSKARAAALEVGLPKSAGMNSNLANILGSADPHPLDMAVAYGTFAAQGVRPIPHSVVSISPVGLDEKPVYTSANDSTYNPVPTHFSKQVMANLTYALQQPTGPGGTGAYAMNVGRPVAGKTGTSSNSLSAWFVGYTPQISTAVALYQTKVGTAGNVPIQPFGGVANVTGGSFPVEIWTSFMKSALQNYPVVPFPQPDPQYGQIQGTPQPTVTQPPSPTGPPSPTVGPSSNPTGSPQPTFGFPTFGKPTPTG